ncbi:unnamed protein product [Caretta caretta]
MINHHHNTCHGFGTRQRQREGAHGLRSFKLNGNRLTIRKMYLFVWAPAFLLPRPGSHQALLFNVGGKLGACGSALGQRVALCAEKQILLSSPGCSEVKGTRTMKFPSKSSIPMHWAMSSAPLVRTLAERSAPERDWKLTLSSRSLHTARGFASRTDGKMRGGRWDSKP